MHCRVPLAYGAPRLAIELRPQTPEAQRALDRGEAIDIEVGDEAFDRAFIVEAAPTAAIRALLDGPTRTALLALSPCRFALDAGDLHLSKQGTSAEPPVVALMVGLCVGVRERVERLPLEMARWREPAGFRDAAREPAMSGDSEARACAELEAVEDVRRTRRQGASANVGLVVLGVVVLGVLLEWITHR
jgi:hypothetical protein